MQHTLRHFICGGDGVFAGFISVPIGYDFRMKLLASLLFTAVLLASDSRSETDEEPHTYTISFFQFNPKDMGEERKPSKKDIKPSDVNASNKTGNGTKQESPTDGNIPIVNEDKHQSNGTVAPPTEDKNSTGNVTGPSDKRHSIPTMTSEEKMEIERDFYRSNVLNPNPRPSPELVNNNLVLPDSKASVKPALETLKAVANIKKLAGKNDGKKPETTLYKASKTSKTKTAVGESTTTNDVKLKQLRNATRPIAENQKNKASGLVVSKNIASSQDNHHVTVLDESESVLKRNSTGKLVTGKKTNLKSEENKQLTKLEKDKKTNKEIQEAAKNIVPIKDSLKKPVNDVMKPSFSVPSTTHKRNLTDDKDLVTKDDVIENSSSDSGKQSRSDNPESRVHIHSPQKMVDESDEYRSTIAQHRSEISRYVPLYKNIGKKDRILSFQRGLMKHPKHNMYPKCHHCPKNSSYAECVKKSTLAECNRALNNICFTKSVKKFGIISYQMGCSNHKKCGNAKAFPCKDGSKDCFTCCQFDRCNSSPHHGDYELDSLDMDELTLDTKGTSSSSDVTITWWNMATASVASLLMAWALS